MKDRPSDWTPTVKDNWPEVVAYIVSGRHPSCLAMASDEVRFTTFGPLHSKLGLDLSDRVYADVS